MSLSSFAKVEVSYLGDSSPHDFRKEMAQERTVKSGNDCNRKHVLSPIHLPDLLVKAPFWSVIYATTAILFEAIEKDLFNCKTQQKTIQVAVEICGKSITIKQERSGR